VSNATPSGLRTDLLEIFRAAVAAVDPLRLVANHLVRESRNVFVRSATGVVASWPEPTLVVGAGKAAGRMAAACETALGPENVRGHVVVAGGCQVDTRSITITEAGHPLPDHRGEAATRHIIELVRSHTAKGILCLISGGASSLLVQPRRPVRLDDKVRTTRLLLECGADIHELNCVRKHLSVVKGGGLARVATGALTSLLISDVVGDDPATIGSGPSTPDATTFGDAWAVLVRYGLTERVPESVAQLLREGMAGRVPETLKPDSPEVRRCCNLMIGSNRIALEGAAQAARSRGWRTLIGSSPLTGDTTKAAANFGQEIKGLMQEGGPLCLLSGGETTVQIKGDGFGGRNQEFALVLAREIAGTRIAVLSAGTDGIDGPTEAAGAFVDGTTLQRARDQGLDADAVLARNDSYTFFAALGDLLCCGPTGTNVMDIKIALIAA
jgi:glycerate 2-kinase